jgi:hypothetical protein
MAVDYVQAVTLLEQALIISREIGDRQGEVEVLNHQGDLLRQSGQVEPACVQYHEALQIARQLGTPLDEARALAGIGRCASPATTPTE